MQYFKILLFLPFSFYAAHVKAQCGATIATFPYQEDFEASTGGWVSGGTGSDWAWGAPGKPIINAAASGQNCWVVGGLTGSFYSLGQRSFVESPCFDFTSLPYPYVRFNIWWESEYQYDGANLQYSVDGGTTWSNVGSTNSLANCLNSNWYNISSITNLGSLANPRHGWAGSVKPTSGSCLGGNGSNGWVSAKHCLSDLGGKPNVRFRFIFGSGTTCNDFDGVAFDDFVIENAPPIVANFSSECAGNSTYDFTDLSDKCPENWLWDFGDPNSGAANTSTAQNPAHTFSGPGLYTVTLRASSSCSGADTITFPIEIPGLAITVVPPSCPGGYDGSASILPNPDLMDPSFAWSTQPPQMGPTATKLRAGTYTVSVNAAGICPFITTVVVPESVPNPTPQTNTLQVFYDTTIALGNSVLLTGVASDPGRILSYYWEPANYLDCDTCLNTNASPLQTTTYTLFATDTSGCVISDAVTITVLLGTVYIPNVFKPASASPNDRFTIYAGKDVDKVELLQVYDRWGSLVFEKQNFPVSDPQMGWDGSIGGVAAAPGVYWYLVKVRFLNGFEEVFKGDLTLLR